ncbi:2-oxoglutarate and iron-dependent oxygenase JMJD4 isoform X2 [Rana temporaria]|uniref:2-oxoglutarate and iron-dependent oxygenase JMJD4 isoform X2 n=1 Tax=Rana temporaria TaxID=8407 RepID=UPI001AADAE76|nr:2-oxoglutarate and iron-dependent oxygenase JMJD4 isoform X2 [Rana temporaria]
MDEKPPEPSDVLYEVRNHIDFIEDPETFSYHEFFHKYMIGNVPCLFSSKFTRSWGIRKFWVSADNQPNWDHLLQNFGDAAVPVAKCDLKEYNANPKEQIPLREYIEYWREHRDHAYQSTKGCLYLKDWHMQREYPDYDAYKTPEYFSSDWLNEYWDAIAVDDYRFVYMGPAGSWTPFHADVFRSYSWSANICGRKKWLLFPPGSEGNLRDCHGNLPYDVTSPALQDPKLFPNYQKCCPPIEVTQEAGEIIFVPSGWHHQVYNVVIMKSCTGIDYTEFYTFLKTIAHRRLKVLETNAVDLPAEGRMVPGPRHALFDLEKIADVLSALIGDDDFQKLDVETLNPPPKQLLQRLTMAMDPKSRAVRCV